MLRYSLGHLEHWKRIKEHVRNVKMNKKRLKVALVVLDAVKSRFPETEKFIDDILKDKCEKEKVTADKVSFYKFRSKELAWKNIFILDLYYSDYYLFIGVERCGR